MTRAQSSAALLGAVALIALILALTGADAADDEGASPSTTSPSTTSLSTTTTTAPPAPTTTVRPWSSPWPELMTTELEHGGDPAVLPDGRWAIVTPVAVQSHFAWYGAILDPDTGTVTELANPPITTSWSPTVASTPAGDVVVCGCGSSSQVAWLDATSLEWDLVSDVPIAGPATMVALDDESVMLVGDTDVGILHRDTDALTWIVASRAGQTGYASAGRLGNDAHIWPAHPTAEQFIGHAVDPATAAQTPLPPPPALSWPALAETVWTGDELIVIGGRPGEGDHFVGAAFDPDTDTWRSLPRALPDPIPMNENLGGHAAIWSGSELWVHVAGLSSGYFDDVDYRGGSVLLLYDPRGDRWLLAHRSEGDAPTPVGAAQDRVLLETAATVYLTPPRWRPTTELVPPGGLASQAGGYAGAVASSAPLPPSDIDGCTATNIDLELGRRTIEAGLGSTPVYFTNVGPDACALPVDLRWTATSEHTTYPVGRVDRPDAQYVDPVLLPGHTVSYRYSGNLRNDTGGPPAFEVLTDVAIAFTDGSTGVVAIEPEDGYHIDALGWSGPFRERPTDAAPPPCAADQLEAVAPRTEQTMGRQITAVGVTNIGDACDLGLDSAVFATIETVDTETGGSTVAEEILVPTRPIIGLQSTYVPYANSILVPGQSVSYGFTGSGNGIVIDAPTEWWIREVRIELESGLGSVVVPFPDDSHAGRPSGEWWGPVPPIFDDE